MAAPTFVASYSTAYNDTSTPKTVSVTTQAGDLVVVCGGDAGNAGTLSTPSGNSISFTPIQTIDLGVNWAEARLWSGVDTTGGTNWTLTVTYSASVEWGFTCIVFRNARGIGASGQANVSNATPSITLNPYQDNSMLVFWSGDWNAIDGTSRTWLTYNNITPTNGNGLELAYGGTAAITFIVYCAYYNDIGAATSATIGLSAPGGQKYSLVAAEIMGFTIPQVQTSAPTSIAATTATANGAVNYDGGTTITERGFVWSTSPNPTTSDNKVTASGTTGSYNASLTSLSSGTLYHVRAYAINSVGTGYGIDVTFQNRGAAIAWTGA